MALVLQNDQGTVEGANAYVSLAEFKAYHDARGNDYSSFDDADIEAAIVRATDFADSFHRFIGWRRRSDQATQWPRAEAYDPDGYVVNGLPKALKNATSEYALRALSVPLAPDPTPDPSGRVVQSKAEAVGPISESVTYVAGAVEAPSYPAAASLLQAAGLLRTGRNVVRG